MEKITISKEVWEEWRSVCLSASVCEYIQMSMFKREHPKEFAYITSMSRQRKSLELNLEVMKSIGSIYWGTLTFNQEQDNKDIKTKRKQGQRYLDKYFSVWLMVEEYGTDNDRYHIHFFGILKDTSITFRDMYLNWHSRVSIEHIASWKIKRKIKYLTKYCAKDTPRIRRNKVLIDAVEPFRKHNDKKFYDVVKDCLELPF